MAQAGNQLLAHITAIAAGLTSAVITEQNMAMRTKAVSEEAARAHASSTAAANSMAAVEHEKQFIAALEKNLAVRILCRSSA
jgi:hypothetical protein